MIQRAEELAQRMGTPPDGAPEGASQVAMVYASHYTAELRARLQRRLLEHVEQLAALDSGPIN